MHVLRSRLIVEDDIAAGRTNGEQRRCFRPGDHRDRTSANTRRSDALIRACFDERILRLRVDGARFHTARVPQDDAAGLLRNRGEGIAVLVPSHLHARSADETNETPRRDFTPEGVTLSTVSERFHRLVDCES